jgi:protein-S-isoprenylcysteine O-methyltransferase Ste14
MDTILSQNRPRMHSKSFHLRGFVGGCILLPGMALVLFSTPCWQRPWSFVAFNAFGWIAFVVYVVFRLWATLYAGGRKDKVLQTEGPYSVTRNPLYFGSFFLAISGALFLKSLFLLLLVVAVAVFYAVAVVKSEEQILEKLFGEQYRAYLLSTPRFFPRFSLYHAPKSVQVDIGAMRREAYRLAGAALLPIVAEVITLLRVRPDWPHLFTLF